jgi:hypothetical protein
MKFSKDFMPSKATVLKWRTFKRLRWMQNFNQSTWDFEILCADSYSDNE